MEALKEEKQTAVHASNPCRQCMPLGASWAFKGIENCMTILHGSQGCATYIRRFMISHFREPIDIGSSSFDETTVIFGGESQLEKAVLNIYEQYKPEIIGIATTCLSETIGDDVGRFVSGLRKKHPHICPIISVSTPSYEGTGEEGYHKAVTAAVKALAGQTGAETESREDAINLFHPMITPADIRWLKDIVNLMGGKAEVFPDYSETLDGGMWSEFHSMPPGGTSVESIGRMDLAAGSVELGTPQPDANRPGYWLQKRFGLPNSTSCLPVGIESTDHFLNILSIILDSPIPNEVEKSRARLIDAYADCHKYLYAVKVVLFGDSSTVEALYRFVSELGMYPVLSFTGSNTGALAAGIESIPLQKDFGPVRVEENWDFGDAEPLIRELKPDLLIGNSKGYKISRKENIPLLRVGFPIHDRFGASRQRILGYEGSMMLLDRIVNVILSEKQNSNGVGYTYL